MRKKEQKTFGYAEVETALAKVFAARGQQLLAMRGRLKAFQRAGLMPETPGRGKVIRYSIENVYNLGFALALANFGLTPDRIVQFVKLDYFNTSWSENIGKNESLFFGLLPFVLNYDITIPFTILWPEDISADKINAVGGSVALINLARLKIDVDRALAAETQATEGAA